MEHDRGMFFFNRLIFAKCDWWRLRVAAFCVEVTGIREARGIPASVL
jgi:hypothetical protein